MVIPNNIPSGIIWFKDEVLRREYISFVNGQRDTRIPEKERREECRDGPRGYFREESGKFLRKK
jgi:hypothetical protein